MKKSLFVLLFILVTLFFIPKIKASEVANWEFLPLGINYLENDNFSFVRKSTINQGTISTIHYIRIIPDTHYYLYFYGYQTGEFGSATITAYNNKKTSLGNLSYNVSGESNDIDFTTPSSCKYIKLVVDVEEDYGYDMHLWDIEKNYILADHTLNVGSLTLDDIKYKGPSLDYSPVISGYDGYYETNINNPATILTILGGVKVIDDVDGDITDEVSVVSDNYTPNRNKVGTWQIVLGATDSSENYSELTINVEVKDTTKPVVNGATVYNIESIDNYQLSYFLASANVTDNYNGDVTNRIVVTSDPYTNRTAESGTFNVICYCTDTSGNRVDFAITINITYVDIVAPVFTGTFSYTTDKSNPITLNDILDNISVNDNHDGNIKSSVKVKEDYYTYAPSRSGTFRVILEVEDESHNHTEQTIVITVSDNVAPTFYLNTQVINIDLANNNLNVSDFVEILERSRIVKTNCSYKVTYDEYTDNKDKPGEYQIILDVNGEPLALTINVIEGLNEKKATLINRIASLFNNFITTIKGFFTKLFRFR